MENYILTSIINKSIRLTLHHIKMKTTPLNKPVTLLAIPGSLRAGSSNHAILRYLSTLAPSTIEYSIYDELVTIPPFDPGLDNDEPPLPVATLRQLLADADGIVICTPEYAFGVPGQLKNMLDWMVSSSSLVDKPVCLITASSVGENAHASLLLTLGALSANVIEEAALLIPFIRAKMDKEGNITDAVTAQSLNAAFTAFLKVISEPAD
ncbi:MAG: azr 2 [Mucilaginibacter sp.]|nr:azr 2 [Mucilaginibacter sp.]